METYRRTNTTDWPFIAFWATVFSLETILAGLAAWWVL
jgi:hypothetical protein